MRTPRAQATLNPNGIVWLEKAMLPLLLAALVLGPQDKPAEKCSLAGIVVDSVSGAPINNADVILDPVDRQTGPAAFTSSNEKGRFDPTI